MRTHHITTPVGTLAVHEHGDPAGPPLVLRHGIFYSSELWHRILPALREVDPRPRLILVDGPAHGASAPPPRGAFTLERDAQATLAVLDALGIPRAVLIGHSWGGMTALRSAASAPDRVRALVLLNTPLQPPTAAGRARFATLTAIARVLGMPPAIARRSAASLISPSSLRRHPSLADEVVRSLAGRDRAGLAAVMRGVLVHPSNGLPALDGLRMPTLVAAGIDDYVLPETVRGELRRRAPHAEIHQLPGGHVSPAESPEETAELLIGWLARLPQSSRHQR